MAKSTKTVEQQLADAKAELATCHRFLDKVQTFSDEITSAKEDLFELQERERDLAAKIRDVRMRISEAKEHIESASNGMLAILEPGPVKFMPMFDRMEKAVPAKHGQNAQKWRELPVSALKLSPISTSLLYEAEILFIGQLQDVILADPEAWWEKITGLTKPIAAAVADKLTDFVKSGGAV